ncbi:MAG: hypothetical protein ACFFCW_08750 [Candidatus Hodarchaeota archaeon]
MTTHQNNQFTTQKQEVFFHPTSHSKTSVSPLRQRFIRDMELVGLADN